MVITFDHEGLSKIHNATLVSSDGMDRSRFLYAVDNVAWDGSVDAKPPCVPENPVSRWKPRPDLNASSCTSELQNETVAALVHALETSNDDNSFLRDIYLWNDYAEDGCHEDDMMARGMLIMTKEGGCWENVHPEYL